MGQESELNHFVAFVDARADTLGECTLDQQLDAYIRTYPGRAIPLLTELASEALDRRSDD